MRPRQIQMLWTSCTAALLFCSHAASRARHCSSSLPSGTYVTAGPTLDVDYHFRFAATSPAIAVRLSDTPMHLDRPPYRPGSDAAPILQDLGMAEVLPALARTLVLQTCDLLSAW